MTSEPLSAPHVHPVRVYWEDTDAGGIVYHASHVRFFERGRTEFLRALGVNQSDHADRAAADALLFAVRRMEIDYLRPAKLDDLLAVTTAVRDVGRSKLVLDQRLLRGDEVVAEAVVTVVAIGGAGRPRKIPDTLAAAFAAGVAAPQ
ncbi:tol-pal system-associated acyl-CoA thioesterase [Oharaeibacter diazotrophicus]|uniref:(3S)-malyl-CoA thioesterase n=1 Tax=Oharaeibacter diazotrophicus TaxID=1920512 RepID=A0A4R6RG38_9HYPH|nr:tol-pal system-associated acyl-CoA thioesterase [Oharaeibacter diazotrophicus]TDP85095.1 (3S)-malyl-CoA thioesterase [Oharaeibacter diazotrophicus]BBE74066.1 acyl-CoA thioester hydrolase YbgC [Pleomorphomonas sp. SM30]GLS76246.1 tol-pal system-associated acyl-CoA thioesterase [Oharaeibacter diazotrophicus]